MNYLTRKSMPFVALIILCSVLATVSAFYLYNSVFKRQIAFIRSAYLIENYQGMKEVLEKYNTELMHQQQEIDSLQIRYTRLQEQLKKERLSSAVGQLQQKEQSLQYTLQRLSVLTNELNPKVQADKQKLMQGALNQINFYVEQYAKENSIALVLGVTLDGNVLYGEDYLDITEEVLAELNKRYN